MNQGPHYVHIYLNFCWSQNSKWDLRFSFANRLQLEVLTLHVVVCVSTEVELNHLGNIKISNEMKDIFL